MTVSGDKKSTRICLDISSLFFHTVPNDILQALAVERDILLLKPFLILSFDGVIRRKSLASDFLNVWQTEELLQGQLYSSTVKKK
jgi:hypothetical protein